MRAIGVKMSGFRNIISSVRSFLKEHMWSFMLFLLIGFLFIIIVQQPGRQLFGHDVALQGDGIPFMEDVISKGRLPYWNPYINAGMPHMASMNANIVFFPTTLIILLLGLPVHLYFLYDCFTGIVLAGIFMYLFIRGMNFSKLTSCISGVFFIACGSFFSYINPGHAVIMIALAFHPLETIVYIYPKFFGFLESTYWGKSQFWLHNDYLGIIPWIFVFAAIYFVFKDKRVKFFLFMAISTLILAFGGRI